MRTNCARSGSLLISGSSATSLRSGIQFATLARAIAHFLPASNLMNFHARSGFGHDDEMLDAVTVASVGALGMLAGEGVTNILPFMAGLSPTTLAIDQYALRMVAILPCANRLVCSR